MDKRTIINSDISSWEEVILIYNSALKEIETKVSILNDEFQHVHSYNPIEHVKCRIKTSNSIVKKLKKNGYEATIQNMVEHVNDIAGVRIICSFASDLYAIAEMLAKQSDMEIINIKDYIKNPKPSGYRSYHMLVRVPIYLSNRIEYAKVEIQIRTVAMDFWASLEHKINYKFEGNVPDRVRGELIECAFMSSELDKMMMALNEEVNSIESENDEN